MCKETSCNIIYMTLAQKLESYLDIAGWEDALGLSNHPLQPVLIDCVEEVNDGSFWETQFLLSLSGRVVRMERNATDCYK